MNTKHHFYKLLQIFLFTLLLVFWLPTLPLKIIDTLMEALENLMDFQ